MSPFAVNDTVFSLEEAAALVDEIKRLLSRVSALEAHVAQLDQLAHKDSLSNLPNRRSFLAKLDRLIADVKQRGVPAAMLFIDVDGLKAINDKFGHNAGDDALVAVGRMLVASVRSSDRVARIGGDEFGIVLEHADELSAWQTASRVIETVTGSQFCVDGICLPLSVTVGVGVIRPDDTCRTVMERADREMYRMKRPSIRCVSEDPVGQ